MQKLFLFIVAIMTSVGTTFAESGTCGNNLTWELTSDSLLTISGTGVMENYTWENRAPWYEYREAIKWLIIEEGVNTIAYYAFRECSNMKDVAIPTSMQMIDTGAFWECSNLSTVYITDIDAWCAIRFNNVTSNPLFYAHKLLYMNGEMITDVVVPNNLTDISHAFYSCSSLRSIELSNRMTFIGDYDFCDCTNLSSISIPNSISAIGEYAFMNCHNLTSIELPEGITSIEQSVFQGCNHLTSVNIPSTVTAIKKSAFLSCQFTSIEIPKNVATIGEYAFYWCTKLTSLTNRAETPQVIDANVFENVDISAITLYVPAGSLTAYQNANVWKDFGSIQAIEEEPETDDQMCIDYTNLDNAVCYINNSAPSNTLTFNNFGAVSAVNYGPSQSSSRHTVHTDPNETDPRTGGLAHTVPEGATASVRLGNWEAENQAERIEYSFVVDTAVNPVLILKYLPILEAPEHSKEINPRIKMDILINGRSVGSCAQLDINADDIFDGSALTPEAIADGWHITPASNGDFVWKDWSTIGINLYYYEGYTVTVQLTTFDCAYSAHCGYCYFTLGCSDNKVKAADNSLVAPEGFNYRWMYASSEQYRRRDGSIDEQYVLSRERIFFPEAQEYAEYAVDCMQKQDSTCFSTHHIAYQPAEPAPCETRFGTCGEHMWWELTCDSVLTIVGYGDMVFDETYAPWNESCEAIKTFIIGDSIESLANSTFWGCTHLSSIQVREHNAYYRSVDGVLFNKDLTTIVRYPIGKEASSYVVPNTVTTIENMAFSGSNGLTSVTIGNSVSSIGENAFAACNNLLTLTLGDSIEFFGDFAFADSWHMTSITNHATSPIAINDYVFSSVITSTCILYVPAGSVEAYLNTAGWSNFQHIQAIEEEATILTIAEAIEIGMRLDSMATSEKVYTIEGFVINAESYNTRNRYQNWYMADDLNATSSQFEAYRCFAIDGNDTLAVVNGYRVQMTGHLYKYYNRSTRSYIIEMTQTPATILAEQQVEGPISPSEALAIGANLASGGVTPVKYIIQGFVSYEGTFDATNGYQTFYIADDVNSYASSNETGGFYIYRGTPITGQAIPEGTYVEITAAIYNYRGTTIENYGQEIPVYILRDAPECRTLTGVCGENLTWTLNTCDGIFTMSGTGAMYNYSKNWAPWAHYVDTAIIEDGVTSLGKYGFYGFAMSYISIPESVTGIAFNTFNVCYNMLNFDVATANPVYSSLNGVLCNKEQTTIIRYPRGRQGEYTIPEGITSVGDGAFNGCSGVTSVSIPNGVTSIGVAGFYACALSTISIPATVEHIDTIAFANCPLTSVYNYALEPQVIGDGVDVFAGIDLSACTLYVPNASVEAYQNANVWKDFGSIEPIGAEAVEEVEDEVVVTPTETTVAVVWPQIADAVTYQLTIFDAQGSIICSLTFNANGQLTAITFNAPARRDGGNNVQTAGFSFTVTGLTPGTTYSYTVTTLDAENEALDTQAGSFTTISDTVTGVDEIVESQESKVESRKLLHNGHLYILREGKMFNTQGQRIK